ncbi:MAG: ATP-binding protein [bacterium]|nr:ATP-binding protein [bacterium]
MKIAEFPENESERLKELKKLFVLDTPAEESIDQLVQLAAKICDTPIALVSLVDRDRQWFKSRIGLAASETPRELAFCAHAILKPDEPLIVEDTLNDIRFYDNPLVLNDPKIRFYAGSPLNTLTGFALGTLCVIDSIPKKLTELQIESLQVLSRQVMFQLELRHALKFSFEALEALDGIQSEKERQIRALQDSNSRLEEYASLTAHDIKEPLRLISRFSTLIANKYSQALGLEGLSYFSKITEAAIRTQKMVENILDYSCIDYSPTDNEIISVKDIIQTTLENLTDAREDAHAKIIYDQMPEVNVSPSHLTRVFQNLISNAIKYSKTNVSPHVNISVEELENNWRFSVGDNGVGINANDLDKIFSPFVRVHTSDQIKGAGLGLAVCKSIVENWKGSIWATSKMGEGSTFYFTIPK